MAFANASLRVDALCVVDFGGSGVAGVAGGGGGGGGTSVGVFVGVTPAASAAKRGRRWALKLRAAPTALVSTPATGFDKDCDSAMHLAAGLRTGVRPSSVRSAGETLRIATFRILALCGGSGGRRATCCVNPRVLSIHVAFLPAFHIHVGSAHISTDRDLLNSMSGRSSRELSRLSHT
jgi:hypothetical protein